ncbi:MAG: histidine phosphatase family protein [Alphaproteobacteria bacterium]|nr:histidine phosphatase family protein [Alphaproteobacteria bacterium]
MSRAVTRWWWVRHAPVVDHGGKIYGMNDVPADTSNRIAFERLAQRLPSPAVLVTSHLSRALQTAHAIRSAGLDLPDPQVEPDLAEQNFGHWQGRTWDDIVAKEKGAGEHKFWTAPADHAPPGGESFVAVVARVERVIGRLTDLHRGRDIVVVAHGGTIRAALANALGLDPDVALGFATENLSTTRIDHVDGPGAGGNWRVAFVNERP